MRNFIPSPELLESLKASKAERERVDALAAKAWMDFERSKESWFKAVSHRVLPPAIYRAVSRNGMGCSTFVKNWLARHVQIREYPGGTDAQHGNYPKGTVEYCLDGTPVARVVFNLRF